jgi:2',3'-cyclic-nucleotide 2'-phosphodiesterase (5'-nucleotidase family)
MKPILPLKISPVLCRYAIGPALALALGAGLFSSAGAEEVTVLHLGDQESWLLSAQGNLRDDTSQLISFYGGIDRLASVMANAETAAAGAGRAVLKLNAGDSFLPGPRLSASLDGLVTAHPDGGQDFYDAIALRRMQFDAAVFGNHEFDLDNTGPVAARFAAVSGTTYLSVNLDFSVTPAFAALAAVGQVAPSKVITTPGGNKIGIIGATTPLLPKISSPPDGIMKAWDANATDAANLAALLPLIQAEVTRLRTEQGVETIIVMSHLQNANNELTVMVPALRGVDLVISGGGHELMTDPDDQLINGGVAATFTSHPVYARDADGAQVPVVTGHFGNRYLGELNASLDDATGALTITGSRMIRVSGRFATDADAVTGDATLSAAVVQPVLDYVSALNAEIIGSTAMTLNGPTHVACTPTPCQYTEGTRNAETGLGNLVADAIRFAGEADVALQNGGGIRTSIAGPGTLSMGDTFNVLPFTNLVETARSVNAAQLKDVLEQAYNATSPGGATQGRFAQVSGMQVFYDSSRTARTTLGTGERIRRVVLDDGTLLIDNGVVVDPATTFALATIDFLANGGDGYPYAANGVVFENATNSILYQEALADLIETPKAQGGLQRLDAADGDEVTANLYGTENAFDLQGRLVDLAVAVASPGDIIPGTPRRDTLVGTAGDDRITPGVGGDLVTGGAGGDTFVYQSMRDAGDVISDFTPYADRIDLTALLSSLGIAPARAVADGHLVFADVTGGVSLRIDADGLAGRGAPRPLLTLRGLTAAQLVPARDLGL